MWVSPDGKIQKLVVLEGVWGRKPSEESECEIQICECPESLLKYDKTILLIGDSDDHLRRTIDICLSTMNEQETAKFKLSLDNISFTITLVRIEFHGYIHEWDAKKKLGIAQKHKEKGVSLFKLDRFKDAAYRFRKSLQIIHSIPINAETPPEEIDHVPMSDIIKLKANLYNNLASCYLKKEAWQLTIDTCKRVFDYDQANVKAHYKLAIGYMKDRNFDQAQKELDIVLASEPDNKAAVENMKHVKEEIIKANAKFNQMVKKMFV